MGIEGRLIKSGKWWAVEVPLLCVFTQGKSKPEAYAMIASAVEELVEVKGFSISIEPTSGGFFAVSSSDDRVLMAFALKQQRAAKGLTQEQVSKNLGYSSKNAYAQYEQGHATPSLDKFATFLKAMDRNLDPILKIS